MKKLYANKSYFNEDTLVLKKLNEYSIYSEFKSEHFKNSTGYVILGEDSIFYGLDSKYFSTKAQLTANDFNI